MHLNTSQWGSGPTQPHPPLIHLDRNAMLSYVFGLLAGFFMVFFDQAPQVKPEETDTHQYKE